MAEDVLITDNFMKSKKTRKPGKAVKQIKDVEEIPLTPHSDTSTKTKARFDQLLRQAVDQGSVTELKPKRRKKKKVPDEDNVLEKLKKGEGLVKDEDAAILANTYVPGDSPKNEKSNNKRDRSLEGTENFAYEDETTFSTPSKKKGKKKKDTNIADRTPSISDLGPAISHDLDTDKTVRKKKLPPLTHEVRENTQKAPSSDTTATEGKKVKKKKKPQPQSAADSEASPVISPDQSPRHVANNKKKVTSETEGTADEISPREGKKKKKKPPPDSHVVGFSEDDPTDAPQKVVKRKKKKVPLAEQPPEEEIVETPRSGVSATGDEAETETAEIVDETTKVKKRRKKKTEAAEATSEGEISRTVEDEGKILAVTIHRTDKLKNDFYILHPVVRVHVVDERTGLYLTKQHNDRKVTSYFENEENSIRHIQPIITQPFDFKQRKSVLPMWEELLIFNENFNYFIQKDPKVILFFELLDFVSMNTASRHYQEAKSEGGWHRIAWAFLKVVGSNDHLNVGSKVRLQLYHPPESYRLDPGPIELYQWWQTIARRPYPSTLYVTLKGITPPSTVMPAMRSLYATQEEVGKMTYQDLKKSMNLTGKSRGEGTQKKYLTTWNRLAGQACKVPNNLYHSLYAGRKGCFVIKFSHDGRSLACACHDQDGFPIFIYEIPSGELLGKLNGHFGIVYDLCWSKTDFLLLSASSDGTARVWEMDELSSQSAEQLLPHPAFVYAAQFHPRVERVVATGGYDQVIRVWQFTEDNTQPELLQEIEGHHGNVNSLCFDEDGTKLYSADSVGSIKIWNVYVSEEPSRRGFIRDWSLYQEIQEPELTDVPINFLKLHPSGRRVLVHCRDNILRMIDLRILRVMQKYIGALNFREEIHSTLSPCGTFVFAGSEDGSAYVWNTDTGDQVACYSELNYRHPVTSVDYHPRDHMVAFCSLGDNQAVFLYKYNPQVAALDAGIPVKPKDNVDPAKTASKSGELTTSASHSKEEFEASETARLEKVMKKLATVTLSSQPMIPAESHPLGQSPRTIRSTGLLGTASSLGYDHSSSYLTPRSQSPPPLFSPHAPQTLGSTMQQQQMSSQKLYYKQGEGSWRPGFSSVGRHGARPGSPTLWGKPPTMSMSASQGKAQFSFHPPVGKAAKLKKVVALYEYKGQRSDELSFLKGDMIKVLYKDNENWWMGELRDGQQGFFPANYVAEEEPSTDDALEDATSRDGGTEDEGGKKKTMAVKTKTGELRFLSATDDSEDDHRSPKRRPRRKKKSQESASQSQDLVEADTSKGRNPRDESYA